MLAAGLLALLNFNSATMRNNADAKNRAVAINLAQAKVEELRAFVDRDGFFDSMENDSDAGNLPSAAYARQWVVDTSTEPAVLTVTVSWTDSANNPQQTVVTSNIYGEDVPRMAERLVWALAGSGGVPTDAAADFRRRSRSPPAPRGADVRRCDRVRSVVAQLA